MKRVIPLALLAFLTGCSNPLTAYPPTGAALEPVTVTLGFPIVFKAVMDTSVAGNPGVGIYFQEHDSAGMFYYKVSKGASVVTVGAFPNTFSPERWSNGSLGQLLATIVLDPSEAHGELMVILSRDPHYACGTAALLFAAE